MSCIFLEKEKVSTAAEALQKVSEKLEQKNLVDEVSDVQVQICLKKIPRKEKTVQLKLPHGLKHESKEICLFVKDLDGGNDRDYEPTQRHFQEMLKKHGVSCVAEVIPLKSLKLEYKPYEAKRNLSNAFDVFLADARIVRLLPTYLGKFFYGKKKTPIQVNLQAKRLKEEIDSAINKGRCVIGSRGASSLAVIGNLEMSTNELTDNIISSVEQISEAAPGGWKNIKQIHIKTPLSTSIPIYLSAGNPKDVSLPKENKTHEKVEAEEISTLFGAKVKVYPSGEIKVIKDGQDDDEPKKKKSRRFSRKKAMLKKGARTAESVVKTSSSIGVKIQRKVIKSRK